MDRATDVMPRRDGFYWEARRICEERDFAPESLPNIEAGLRHRAFMEAIQPILRAQAEVMRFAIPRYVVRSDGRLTMPEVELSDGQRESLAALNQLIIHAAQQHGLDYCPLPASPTPQDKR